jgi:hypothetical protein
MNWIKVKPQNKKLPAWLCSAVINDEGTVFAPAALTGNEQSAVLSASWDGAPAVIRAGHVFLPTSWLARDCPQIERLCEKIEEVVRAAAAAQGCDGE